MGSVELERLASEWANREFLYGVCIGCNAMEQARQQRTLADLASDRLRAALTPAERVESEAAQGAVPSYDALLIIAQSVCGALERADVTDCDDPGEAIDMMRESYERRLSAPAATVAREGGEDFAEAMRKAYEPDEYEDAFKPARPPGFGIACTCAWTEIVQAMRADGIDVPDKCGPKTRAWIVALVEREFATPTQGASREVGEVSKEMVERAARTFADISADECNIDREDNWKTYSEIFIRDARKILAAALKDTP